MGSKDSSPDRSKSKEDLRTISHLDRKAVTFKGGRDRLAHKWYRLTPSFSPELVTRVLEEFGNENTRVLDPFSGRGTTPIQCQIQNVPCMGIEINPMLQFAGKVSLNWDIPSSEFSQATSKIIEDFRSFKRNNSGSNSLEIAEKFGIGFPQIHNVHRWWREDVLCDLLILKGTISDLEMSHEMRDLFFLNLCNIIIDVANITLGRLQLHFIDREGEDIDSLVEFENSCIGVANDLLELNDFNAQNKAENRLGDSTKLASIVMDLSRISLLLHRLIQIDTAMFGTPDRTYTSWIFLRFHVRLEAWMPKLSAAHGEMQLLVI